MRTPPLLTLVFALLFAALATLLFAAPVVAQSPVEDCSSDAELRADIAASQVITFTCGAATIPLTAPILIDKYVEIDGGSVITLSGGGITHHFEVGAESGTLRLRNIALIDGAAPTVTVPITAPAAGSILSFGVLLLENVTLANNSASSEGGAGAIYSDGFLEIRGSQISGNSGGASGAIVAQYDTRIIDTILEGNSGVASGAILGRDLILLNRVEVRDNRGVVGAGAIRVEGEPNGMSSVQLLESTVDGNDGQGCSAIQSKDAAIFIQFSTISRNISRGGGTLCLNANHESALNIDRSTISLNQSQNAAIVLDGNSYAYLQSSTIVLNRPGTSDLGGIMTLDGTIVAAHNVILFGNGDAQCGEGMSEYSSFSFSVLGDRSCPELNLPDFDPHNRYGDPLLGPLADNGGLTETHLPGDESIAQEMGTHSWYFSGCYLPDQRGVPRWHGLCDAGSVEVEVGEYSFLPVVERP